MSKKSTWRRDLAALRQLESEYFNGGRETGEQFSFDLAILALSDPDVMGKDRFGPKRLARICEAMAELAGRWHAVLNLYRFTDETRVLFDEQLQRVLGETYTPFYERYPYLRKTKEAMESEQGKQENQTP